MGSGSQMQALAPRRSELLELGGAAETHRDRLSTCVGRLQSLRDRVFGSRPTTEDQKGPGLAAIRAGALGEIDGTMVDISRFLDELESVVGDLDQIA